MKNVKWALMAVSIFAGTGGAVATRTCDLCEYSTQYKLQGGSYVPAGDIGNDYLCWNVGGICTYYKPTPSSDYEPCQLGMYVPLH